MSRIIIKWIGRIALVFIVIMLLHEVVGARTGDSRNNKGMSVAIDLSNLNPSINFRSLAVFPGNNVFAMDEASNYYFLDMNNDRILKYDICGNYIGQLGGDSSKNSLSSPTGILIVDDLVYVIDQKGQLIKIFDLDGNVKNRIFIGEGLYGNSLSVIGDKIFVNVTSKVANQILKENIRCYSKEGHLLSGFGEAVHVKTHSGRHHFNITLLGGIRNIYGAFRHFPILFSYTHEGRQLFFKSLEKSGISEIESIIQYGKVHGADSPFSIKNKSSVRSMVYCYGFIVDVRHIYFAMNVNGGRIGIVLVFNLSGELEETYSLKIGDQNCRICKLYYNESLKKKYCIAEMLGNFYLCTF